MAWADMRVQGAVSILQGVGSYIVAKQKAKNDELWRRYNNKMVGLQNAQNQNNITTNENMARERSAEQAYQIRKSEYATKASVEVAAAATGTTGRSVDAVMFDVGRNAARADAKRQQDLEYQILGFNNQRIASDMQTAQATDYSRTPEPSLLASTLGVGTNLYKLWGENGRPGFGSGTKSSMSSAGVPIPAERVELRL